MTIYVTQANFSRGEAAPRLTSRLDIDLFKQALKYASNWIFLKHGGLTRRPGYQYMGSVKTHSKKVRLVPFVFGTLATGPQAYMLEFGDQYIRVFTPSGQVMSGGPPSPVEIASPWTEAQLPKIDYVQSADVLYITHPSHQTRTLTRTSDTSWTLANYVAEDGPYLDEPKGAHASLKFSATGNLVPKMTSLTAPSGTVSGSSVSAADTWNAFDRDLDTAGIVNRNQVDFIAYDFAGATTKICVGFSMRCRINENYFAPREFNCQGFDGTDWITLDNEISTEDWGVKEKRWFPFENGNAYFGYRVQTISRGAAGDPASANIGLVEIQFAEDPATQAAITCTASSTAGINGGAGFSADDVGRSIRLRDDDNIWRWFEITGYTSSTVVTGVMHGCPLNKDNTAITRWRLGAFSKTTGWPRHTSFFDERLAFGSTDQQPKRVWLSKTNDFTDHGVSAPLLADDAMSLEMTGGEINSVQFLSEGYDLIVGTTGAIRTIGVNNTNEGFGADNAKQLRHSSYGVAEIKPVLIGNVSVAVDYYSNILREITYSFELNGYVTPELTVVSEHLFAAGITQLAFAQSPIPLIVTSLNGGGMVATTYDRDQKVVASGRWMLGGTSVEVESVATIPGPDRNEVWAAVKRTINGSTKRYIERMGKTFKEESDAVEDVSFLDSYITYFGAASNAFVVPHLAGETIKILANGVVHNDRVVDGAGNVTLPVGVTATKAIFGYGYQSKAELLRVPDPTNDGSRWGRRVKIQEVCLDVLGALGLKVGNRKKLFELFIRDQNDPVPGPMLLREGFHKARIEASWFNTLYDTIVIQADDPLPATVLSATLAVEGEP